MRKKSRKRNETMPRVPEIMRKSHAHGKTTKALRKQRKQKGFVDDDSH